jgi:hypothetical protein
VLQILSHVKNKKPRGRESCSESHGNMAKEKLSLPLGFLNSESHGNIHIFKENDGTEWDFNFEYMTCKRKNNVRGREKIGNTIDFRVVEGNISYILFCLF